MLPASCREGLSTRAFQKESRGWPGVAMLVSTLESPPRPLIARDEEAAEARGRAEVERHGAGDVSDSGHTESKARVAGEANLGTIGRWMRPPGISKADK